MSIVHVMRRPLTSNLALIGFLLCVALLGVWRTHHVSHTPHIEHAGTGSTMLTGRIAAAPDIRDTSIVYVLDDLLQQEGGSGTTLLGGHILVYDRSMWPRYVYGETVRVTGAVQPATDDGYGRSLRARNIHATMFAQSIATRTSAPWSAFGTLISVREAIEGTVRQFLPEPEASLAVGLLTGSRASFPQPLTDALRRSGLTHITAVSGFNVAIVLVLLEQCFFWVPRRLRIWPLLLGLFLFTLFTGASASVVRAAIMGGLGVMALHAGRLSHARRGVILTAGIMLLFNPRLLVGDLGFQLSFLSVIGILECVPLLEPLLKRIPNVLALRESIALTIASQLTAAPWIAYALGNISIISLPANLLAGPLIPLSMLLSALATALSPLGLGLIVGFCAYIPLTLIIAIAYGTSALPFAAMNDVHVPLWALVVYYAFLAGMLWTHNAMRSTRTVRNEYDSAYPTPAASMSAHRP